MTSMRRVGSRGGFSLLEALVAMSIASLLVILVSQVFLAQNQFYSHAIGQNLADDAVRTAAEFLGEELRGGLAGGVVEATRRGVVIRSAVAVGGVCSLGANDIRVFVPGINEADTTEVAGYALRDAAGDWTFVAMTWELLFKSSGDPARNCADQGVDTTGARDDFIKLNLVGPSQGDLVMLYRETAFSIGASSLDPKFLALYRGENGATAVELATGLMSASQFEYLVMGYWMTEPYSGLLGFITEIRATLETSGEGDSTATTGYSTSMSVRVPLQSGGD